MGSDSLAPIRHYRMALAEATEAYRCIRLEGPPGIGKSSLLQAWVADLRKQKVPAIYIAPGPEPLVYRLLAAAGLSVSTNPMKRGVAERILARAFATPSQPFWSEIVQYLSGRGQCALAVDDAGFELIAEEVPSNCRLVTTGWGKGLGSYVLQCSDAGYAEGLCQWIHHRLKGHPDSSATALLGRSDGSWGCCATLVACLRAALYLQVEDLPARIDAFGRDFLARLTQRVSPRAVTLLARIARVETPLPLSIFTPEEQALLERPELRCLLLSDDDQGYTCNSWLTTTLNSLSLPSSIEGQPIDLCGLDTGTDQIKSLCLTVVAGLKRWSPPLQRTLLWNCLRHWASHPDPEVQVELLRASAAAQWPDALIELCQSQPILDVAPFLAHAHVLLAQPDKVQAVCLEGLDELRQTPMTRTELSTGLHLYSYLLVARSLWGGPIAPLLNQMDCWFQKCLLELGQKTCREGLVPFWPLLVEQQLSIIEGLPKLQPTDLEALLSVTRTLRQIAESGPQLTLILLETAVLKQMARHTEAVQLMHELLENRHTPRSLQWLVTLDMACEMAEFGSWEESCFLNRQALNQRRAPEALRVLAQPVASFPAGLALGGTLGLIRAWRQRGWYSACSESSCYWLQEFRRQPNRDGVPVDVIDLVRERSIAQLGLNRPERARWMHDHARHLLQTVPQRNRSAVRFRLDVQQARLEMAAGLWSQAQVTLQEALRRFEGPTPRDFQLCQRLILLTQLQLNCPEAWHQAIWKQDEQESPWETLSWQVEVACLAQKQDRAEARQLLQSVLERLSCVQAISIPQLALRSRLQLSLAMVDQDSTLAGEAAHGFARAMTQRHGYWRKHWLQAAHLWLKNLSPQVRRVSCSALQAQAGAFVIPWLESASVPGGGNPWNELLHQHPELRPWLTSPGNRG